ncbi:MAG: ATP-grasp domain-containing protein [Rhodospirillaceae bacterium]|nr:ATP-grasp domain-containing protein [Rhodospirillaceae bacterium]
MLKRVLIANRGEIACRVIRTLRAMGIGSVAVYHLEDRGAPHLDLADERVLLHGHVPTAAYLDQDQIIAACKATGADGLHPGYGFLSENAGFAARTAKEGIAFIGPDADVIKLMGDKILSRNYARKLGIPIAPSATQTGTLEHFIDQAAAIGFPLLIKASAGGGGKGMKIVRAAKDLEENIRMAAGEAQRYFADGRVYAEKLLEQPRHIEVQVLGDGKGNVIHLFERECSIQRRYQKVVEESPAPNLDWKLRDQICAAAVKLASAAKYKNAGTVEFILSADGTFYFLEMNTRLQVEHPVTEMVTGVDLVAEQIKIASGLGLSFAQQDIVQKGSAIEVRVCAERPERDFQPAVGRVGLLRVPVGGKLRFDAGIREGQVVTPAFDSMLAKLICCGDTRADAVAGLSAALRELVILGVPTNVDFLARIARNGVFKSGKLHTGFIGEQSADLAPPALAPSEEAAAVLTALFDDADFRRAAFDVPEPYASIGAWRN